MQNKKVTIFHHDDHDGIVSASIIINNLMLRELFYTDYINTVMVDYSIKLKDLISQYDLKNNILFFVDYSFSSKENIEWLLQTYEINRNIIWIDHHKTSIDLCENNSILNKIPGVRCEYGSGAMLSHMYMYTDTDIIKSNIFDDIKSMPYRCYQYRDIQSFEKDKEESNPNRFMRLIDDYDRWAKKMPESVPFHYGTNINKDPFHDYMMDMVRIENAELMDFIIDQDIKLGNRILESQYIENKEYHMDMYSFKFFIELDGRTYKCVALNRKGNSIMFGEYIYKYDIVCPFYFNGETWKYSLFTEKDDVNCEKIAKALNGGGHRKAAGFVRDNNILRKQITISL